jgi:hypothetical protein
MPVQIVITLDERIGLQRADNFVEVIELIFGKKQHEITEQLGTLDGSLIAIFPQEIVDCRESFISEDGAYVVTDQGGVRYGVTVGADDDGNDNIKFTTDPPPRGLHRIRYEWTGNLKKKDN